ncbi:hypothetical protein [Antrihabitans spumae]|uniref:Uncharacterized protein n=1 Tax=Antrihabitans spumae TaxID=3373370 RepID=A0ABW7JX53_9NOCA
MRYSPADLSVWQLDWRFVGVVVEASMAGRKVGDAALWTIEHGVMGNGEHRDALGRGGAFAGDTQDHVVSEAIMDAVDTLRVEGNRAAGMEGQELIDTFTTPTIAKCIFR